MDRNEIENGVNKLESLGGDDRVIADLLSALPRVEAPANFEFGVNAKIAAGQPQVSSGIPSFEPPSAGRGNGCFLWDPARRTFRAHC
jgi:hypothetical protein